MHFDLAQVLCGLLVGTVVGFTGVGGGSLMAPIMILLLGVTPVTAVGTDLWFAAITKSVGGAVHHRHGNADLRVVKWLCIGSIPAALLTVFGLSLFHGGQIRGGLISRLLGAVLLLTAAATIFRPRIRQIGRQLRLKRRIRFREIQLPLTIGAGAVLGLLVTLTSVGAGALCATVLVFLFPVRLKIYQIVGTDIVHAIPLTLVAGLGHLWLGNVDARLLFSLLCGSIPGIVLASMATSKLNEQTIQTALSLVLLIVGLRLVLV